MLPEMADRSSVHAYGGMIEHSVNAATKAAMVGFTRPLSLELMQKNVLVTDTDNR